MEANTDLKMNASLLTSQSLMLIFSFLDTKSLNFCKLVNKEWSEQTSKYYQHREMTLYKQFFSYNQEKNYNLNDDEINDIRFLLLKFSKALTRIREKTTNERISKQNLIQLLPKNSPKGLEECFFYAFAVILDSPRYRSRKYEDRVDNGEDYLIRFLWIFGCRFTLETLGLGFQESAWVLLNFNEEKMKKIEEFFEKMGFDFGVLEVEPKKKNWLGFWIKLVFDCAKKRFGLSEKCQEVFEEIFLNAPDSLKEELVRVNRCRKTLFPPFSPPKIEIKKRESKENIPVLGQRDQNNQKRRERIKIEIKRKDNEEKISFLGKKCQNRQEEISNLKLKLGKFQGQMTSLAKEHGIKVLNSK